MDRAERQSVADILEALCIGSTVQVLYSAPLPSQQYRAPPLKTNTMLSDGRCLVLGGRSRLSLQRLHFTLPSGPTRVVNFQWIVSGDTTLRTRFHKDYMLHICTCRTEVLVMWLGILATELYRGRRHTGSTMISRE